MLIKFPQLPDNSSDNSFIAFGDIPYAKHNIVTKTSGKQVGFLSEHSVMFIIQGRKYFHFGEQTVCINSNELILVKRGIYTISEFVPQDGCFEALIIFIPDKFIQTFYKHHEPAGNNIPASYTIVNGNNLLEQFRNQYLHYFTGKFEGKQQLLQLKLQELFLLLLNCAAAEQVKSFISSCINKENIDIEYIVKSNLFQPLSIEDYAKLCMRSLASFKRDFKNQFRESPKQWINRQRILHALSLVNTTNKTVAEIASECGFENTSHFIRLFKKQTGFTPKHGRAKITTI